MRRRHRAPGRRRGGNSDSSVGVVDTVTPKAHVRPARRPGRASPTAGIWRASRALTSSFSAQIWASSMSDWRCALRVSADRGLRAGGQRDGDDAQRDQHLDQREAARASASTCASWRSRRRTAAGRRWRCAGCAPACPARSARTCCARDDRLGPELQRGRRRWPSAATAAPGRPRSASRSAARRAAGRRRRSRRVRGVGRQRTACRWRATARAPIPAGPPAARASRSSAVWPVSRSAKPTPAVAIAMMATTTSSSSSVKPACAARRDGAASSGLLPAADVGILALAAGLAVGAEATSRRSRP